MKQTNKKPVRINIQNKDLWEKEAKLIKRWKKICNIMCIISILTLIGIWPLCEFRDMLPSWFGIVYAGWYILVACFGSFALSGYKIHKTNFYEYKFGKNRKPDK